MPFRRVRGTSPSQGSRREGSLQACLRPVPDALKDLLYLRGDAREIRLVDGAKRPGMVD